MAYLFLHQSSVQQLVGWGSLGLPGAPAQEAEGRLPEWGKAVGAVTWVNPGGVGRGLGAGALKMCL